MLGNTSNSSIFQSKWGPIKVLNGGNYAEFHQSCVLALLAAGFWNMVTGVEEKPSCTATTFVKKAIVREGHMLLLSRVKEYQITAGPLL